MPVEVYKGVEFQEADSIGKITVGEHTSVYVYDNGIISDLTVSSGGSVYIEENGNLGSAVINNGGEIYISAGGSADSVTISAGGSAVVAGSVSNLYWTPGYGHLFVHDGADVTYASSYSGVYYGSKGILYKQSANMSGLLLDGMQVSAFVMSGGTAEDFTLQNGGNLYVYSGGYAEDIVFAGNGNMYIYSGGTASDITVTEGGHLYISSGASALNVIWTPGIGTVTVKDGGYITYADVGGVYLNSNGQFVSSAIIMNDQVLDRNMDMYVMSNGRALNVMVNSGGKLVVSSGGSASVKFNPWQGKGAVSSTTGAEVEFLQRDAEIYYGSGNKFISKYANTLSDFEVVSDTELFIYDKADVSNISAVGGTIYISGGVLQNISAGNGGTVNIYSGNLSNASVNESGHINISGGILSTTHINSGGFNVTNGGSAVETIISQGSMSVSKASASDIILSAGLLSVVSGNLAEVVLAGGSMLMSAGGSASNVDVNSGAYMYIGADAAVSGNVLNNDGRVNVGAGGTLENMKISGGTMVVSSGGTALAVDWTPCVGNVNVMSGASVTFVKELSGVYYGRDNQLISNQASMKNSSVEQAVAHVMTGGSISDIIISSAGSVYMAGGSAERTTVNSSGLFHIYNGTVENTAINSNGKVFVYAGASLCNTTIASGGSLNLDSGAIHSGTMQLAAGAIVYTEEKTSIIFDISERNTADGWIINNFSQIQGTPSYVIKVSATQKAGTYKLAQGAENFNGTISVGDGSISYGAIKVNGSVFKYNEVDYKLTLEKGELDLSIGDFTAPDLKIVADKTEWTNTDVVLTATASDGVIEYFDGENWIAGENMTVENNGTYTFRVTDVAGNISEKTFEVANIDKTAPTLEITGNAVEWTNKDIILTAVVSDGTVEFFNGETWLAGNTFTISENGTYKFKVSDEAGNVTEQEIIVDKIDKIAPTLEITADKTEWTNTDIVLTASASDGIIEYFDGENWIASENMTVEANGTYTFRVTDVAGNVTEKTFEVANIDKTAPTLEINADKTEWTNTDVILTASASDGIIEYFDGEKWIAGENMTVENNGTYTFRVTDVAGNITEKTFEVTNIDKVAPTLEITGNAVEWTNKDIILTAVVSDGTVEFFNGETWLSGNSFTVSENGTYRFKVSDEAGNVTEQEVIVDKIDKIAPTLEITADKTEWTNTDIVLTASASDGVIEYFDGESWIAGENMTVEANGTYTFRVTDVAGNVTEKTFEVTNIDKVAPTLEITGNAVEWTNKDIILTAVVSDGTVEFFNGETWLSGNSFTVSENGTYRFKVSDEAGNVTEQEVIVDKIDKIAPTLEITADKTEWTNTDVILTVSASDGIIEYFDGENWIASENMTVEANGTYTFRVTDVAGNVTEKTFEVANIDKNAPTLKINADKTEWTNTDVILTASASDGIIEYFDGESWIAGENMTVETNGTYTFRVTDVAGNVTEKTFEVTNIDKVAPTLEITGNAVEWTNKDIILTAVVSDGAVEFFNGETWLSGNSFTVSENGTYRFKVSDEAGNVTEQEIIVDKIDKNAPTLEINADKTERTNTDIVLTASASDGIIEYFDGESWIAGENMTVETNGTYTFRVTDLAGNITEKTFEVTNIDKVAPTLEITGNAVEWTNKDIILTAVVSDGTVEFFNGETWLAGNTFTISENGTYRFKVSDEAGNVTEQEVIVDKIDKIAPTLEITADKTEWTNTDVVLTATASAGIIEYFDGGNWIAGKNMTVETNGTYTFRVTDVAGNVTEKTFEVANIDKTAPTLEINADKTEWTNTDVVLTATASDGVIEYFDGENWIAGENMTVEANGTYTFRVTDLAGNVTEKTFEVANIDKVAPEILLESDTVNIIPYADVKVSVNESATIYFSSDNESWEIYDEKMHFFENGIYYFKAVDIAGNEAVSSIEFNNLAPLEIAGLEFNADRISWVTPYKNYKIVELVNDKWNDPFIFTADSDAVDIFGMDNGIYQCRVRLENSEIWSENVTFENTDNLLQAEKFISETNEDTDLFFCIAKGIWNDKFNAERQGFYRPGDYKEKVSLNGKNKIVDIFCGSEDANILILTDDLNGDALFVEDVFSAFGEDARLNHIDKILAGAGDDIIDMTGWRFEYIGDGMIIDGGDGNDVIWAGTENDIITGGAGNDRMHGGGGTDIFCFGGDFGNDTVDQADDGKIILCFADSNYTWDAEKRVCCYGSNTVTVLGAAEVGFSDKLPL